MGIGIHNTQPISYNRLKQYGMTREWVNVGGQKEYQNEVLQITDELYLEKIRKMSNKCFE